MLSGGAYVADQSCTREAAPGQSASQSDDSCSYIAAAVQWFVQRVSPRHRPQPDGLDPSGGLRCWVAGLAARRHLQIGHSASPRHSPDARDEPADGPDTREQVRAAQIASPGEISIYFSVGVLVLEAHSSSRSACSCWNRLPHLWWTARRMIVLAAACGATEITGSSGQRSAAFRGAERMLPAAEFWCAI